VALFIFVEMEKFCKRFEELDIYELYALLGLRNDVFILEQDCHYRDIDGKDLKGHHVLLKDRGEMVAYARILPQGISYDDYVSIGRVLTKGTHRGIGLGKELMNYTLEETQRLHPGKIKISAQAHLEKFYNELGFFPTGETYLEDDIPHIGMIYGK
jgi:ElaA protein